MIRIGVIADDFTGAGDAASFLKLENACCILLNGIPNEKIQIEENVDVVVIALKTRSISKEDAVQEGLRAYEYLQELGVEKIYFKYGSTFDSTHDGNIGPVLDRLLEEMDLKYTIISPALPINDRKVKDGILLVDGVPIDETHMRHHPANPMDESELKILIERQSKYKSYHLSVSQMEFFLENQEAFKSYIQEKSNENEKFYLVVDYYEEEHGQLIANLFKDLALYSGSSALPAWLYNVLGYSKNQMKGLDQRDEEGTSQPIKGGVLAGSLSQMTQKQIIAFINAGYAHYKISGQKLYESYETVESEIKYFIDQHIDQAFIVHSDSQVESNPVIHNEIRSLMESALAFAGKYLIDQGIENLIVAGGETSGAVIKSIDQHTFYIGEVVSPGVPVLIPKNHKNLKVVLKSGNFGEENFFVHSLKIMGGENQTKNES